MNIKILAISIISNLIIGAGLFFFHILAPKLALIIMVAVLAGLASIFISVFIEHAIQKALWYHCRKGNTAQALYYISAGANVNAIFLDSTILHAATYCNNAQIIQKLIAAGANADATDYQRRTPLNLAVENGNANAAMELIPITQNIDRPSTNGNTALLLATKQGSYNLVEALIQAGANVNIRNRQGFTPLHNAAYMGRIGAINLLIQAGADFHATTNNGNTALTIAAEEGHPETAAALIENGAKVNASNNQGNIPLHWAALNGHTEVTVVLIQAGANPHAIDENGKTPLHITAQKGHPETAAALIENGANPNAADYDGDTPLHWAALNGHTKIAVVLIQAGANINAIDQNGKTPLHSAIESGAYATALAIIHYGQVPDQQIPYIENNQTSRRIHRLYKAPLPKNFGTMMPIKIYFTSTKGKIKNIYRVIVTMMHNRHKNNRTSLSSLPLDALNQILQYAGLSLSSQVICHESLLPTSEKLKLNKKEKLSQEKVDSGLSQNDHYPLTTSTPAA